MSTREEAATVAALVAGEPITVQQVSERLAAIRRGPLAPWLPRWGPEDRRSRRWVLRLLVTEAIVSHHTGFIAGPTSVLEGDELSINGADLTNAESLAAAARLLFEQITAGIQVSEEEVSSYYRHNLDRYYRPERRLIRHQVARSLPRARLVGAGLATGEGVSSRFEIRRGEFSGPLEDAVFAAQIGELIGPTESELGWHVAILEAVFESGYVPYQQVQSEIESDLLSVARGRAFDQWLEQERHALTTVVPGWGHPGDPSLPDFSHRH